MKTHRAIRRSALAAAAALAASTLFADASFGVARPGPSAPATPTSVALVSGNRALVVSWSEASSGAIQYTATAKAAGKPTRACHVKVTSCRIASLVNGTVYLVTVVAKNVGGSSAPSAPVTAVAGVPGPPLTVHTTAGTAMATVSWAPPKASGVSAVTGYLAVAMPGGFACSTSGTLLTMAARTCQIAGLQSGTTYTVTVVATNAYGAGTPSKPANVTPS